MQYTVSYLGYKESLCLKPSYSHEYVLHKSLVFTYIYLTFVKKRAFLMYLCMEIPFHHSCQKKFPIRLHIKTLCNPYSEVCRSLTLPSSPIPHLTTMKWLQQVYSNRLWNKSPNSLKGGTTPETNEIVTNICSCHNFFPLSSVQIIFIPACCLLCVL